MKINKLLLILAAAMLAVPQAYAGDKDKKPKEDNKPVFERENMPEERPGMGFRSMPGQMPGFGMEAGEMRWHGFMPGGNMNFDGKRKHGDKIKDKKDKKDKKFGKDKDKKNPFEGKRNFMFPFQRGGFRGGMPGMRKNIMPENEIMSLVKESDSAFAKRLAAMQKDSPMQYRKAIAALSMKLSFVKDKKEYKAQINKIVAGVSIETEVSEKLSKYRKAADADKPALKAELKTGLEKLFDLRIEEQQNRLTKMEEALSEQKKKLNERKSNKSRIVESRIDEITGEGFRW